MGRAKPHSEDSRKRRLRGHASNPGRRIERRGCRVGRGNSRSRRAGERGQAAVFLVLVFGIFLIAGAGFVVDGANLWFHRQTAQTAADAACAAGAMDLLSSAGGVTPPAPWIPASDDGSGFECSGTTGGSAPCSYANLNGYPGTGSTAVEVSFPELAIARACPPAPPFFVTVCAADGIAATPYMRVDVQDNVPTTFMRLLGAQPASSVPAKAVCGLTNVLSPLPILVLNPNAAGGGAANTFTTSTGALTILGGAEKSIQVNSLSADDSSNLGLGTGLIDLRAANGGKGGEIAVAKHEPQPVGAAIDYGASGKWVERAGIISDPFATISAPDPGSLPPESVVVQLPPSGCTGVPGIPPGVPCDLYAPGRYPNTVPCPGTASGVASICVNGTPIVAGTPITGPTGLAVFQPGIYYLDGDFFAGTNSCLRPNTPDGAMFYLSGSATLAVTPASGGLQIPATGSTPAFNCTSPLSGVPLATATCPGGALGLPGVPVLTGNVLLAPCDGTYGDPLGQGTTRGILFFHDRTTPPAAQPLWSSFGSFALVGNLYFHCGASCAASAFTDTLSLGSGAPSYIVGGIVADQLSFLAASNIIVSLNPNPQYYVLKASLLQ